MSNIDHQGMLPTCRINNRRQEVDLSDAPLDLSTKTSESSQVTSNPTQLSRNDRSSRPELSSLSPINITIDEYIDCTTPEPNQQISESRNCPSNNQQQAVHENSSNMHCYDQHFPTTVARPSSHQPVLRLPSFQSQQVFQEQRHIESRANDLNREIAVIPNRYFELDQNLNPHPQYSRIDPHRYNPLVKDIVPLLMDFDPSKISINAFLQNVDRIASMYNPHELVLLHAVTLKLKENAKKWYESMNVYFHSWQAMKEALINEFADSRDAVDIHRELERRKCGTNENLIDYAYTMRRIAAEASIPEQNVIKYIISGLPNHHLMYSLSVMKITTFSELMLRLRAHNAIARNSSLSRPHDNSRFNQPQRAVTQNQFRDKPYQRDERRIICARCKRYGHYAINCNDQAQDPKKKQENSNPSNVKTINCVVAECENMITVRINGINVEAFVDLGSECSILAEKVANRMFEIFNECNQILRGFGNGFCSAIGKITAEVVIDGVSISNGEFLVVEKMIQPASCIIGRNLLNQKDVIVLKGYNFMKVLKVPSVKNNVIYIEKLFGNSTCKSHATVLSLKKDEFCSILQNSIGKNINELTKTNLLEMFDRFRDCFAMDMQELGLTTKAQIEIKLKDDKPVCYQPYRLSFAQRETVMEHVKEMLENNIISPSSSPYASPIVIVKKKSGEDRICIDYRKLNNITVKDHFPIPNMDDQLQRLAGMQYFSVVDLASGYYQLPVAANSRSLTAFVTPDGKWEFNRMPFGLVNAPAAFQRMINMMASELGNKIVPYLDDVVVPSKTIQEGVDLLQILFEKLREYGLTLKPSKCKFLQQEIEFLGHEVSPDGIRAGKEKIVCVEKFETPTNVKDIRRFIGLASYFRKFVPKFSQIARPLTDLTKKGIVFNWGHDQDSAFNQLKTCLCARDTLALYDPLLDHELHTDASSIGLAGILIQVKDKEKRPVAYFSRKTNQVEQMYHSYELETMAVVESVERFRVYLLGKPFLVITDCESLRTSATKKNLIPRVARWWLRLQEFNFEIKHRSGEQMVHVDALSRAPVLNDIEAEGATLDVFTIENETKWMIALQKEDRDLLGMKIKIIEKNPALKDFVIKDECVYYKTENGELLFVVPKCLRSRIVSEVHSSGHLGLEKTLSSLKKNYWFSKMRSYVKRHIVSCVECLYQKEKGGAHGIELHPIEKVPIPQHTWHIDHLGPFPKSSRKNAYIIVIVDAFTKYTHLKAAKDVSTKFVIRAIDDIIIHFGTPSRIITDRGSSFTSGMFERYCVDLNIKHILNATATPRANGQVERVNRILVNSLRTMSCGHREQNWEINLRKVQWTINTTTHSVTNKSPHELLFGYTPRGIFGNKLSLQLEDDRVLEERKNYEDIVQDNREQASMKIQKHQTYSKEYFNKKHKKPEEFAVGNLVMVKREAVSTGASAKLQPKFRGPYKIISKLYGDRYRVTDIAPVENKRKFTGVFPSDSMKFVECPEVTSSDTTGNEED